MNPDELKIRHAIDDFVRAYNQGDVDRLRAVYAADFIDMSEDEETKSGEHAWRDTAARLRDTFARFTPHLSVQVDEIDVAGDRAFERGTLLVQLQPKGAGEPVRVERRFLEIWRREPDGNWRVTRAMDNSTRSQHQSLDFRR